MTRSAEPTVRTSAPPALVLALRVLAILSVLAVVLQGISAGELVGGQMSALGLHYAGAYAVHVTAGLAMIAAFLVNRASRGPWWPTVLAVVVFALGFLQAAVGNAGIMTVHVPLAMLLLGGAVWLVVWACGRARTA